MDCMISLEIPPLHFQSTMSRTQLQYVLRHYLANPLWNPLASFVDNCVRAVWMKQLKLRARGWRNIARKPCSDQFYWLYLNPSSFDTSHQHPASAPGHIMYFWELLNSDCLTPFPSHKQHILATCLLIPLPQNSFADPKATSEKGHILVKRLSKILLLGSPGTMASINSETV